MAVGGWQPGNTIRTAIESLVQILQGVADILIWLVIVVLPFAIVVYVAYRIYRRFWPRKVPSSIGNQPVETEPTSD